MCHLLCCPAGVAKWAAPFLQVSLTALILFCNFIAIHKILPATDSSFEHDQWSAGLHASSVPSYVPS